MAGQSTFSEPTGGKQCPIRRTHRRLVEAHLLWHQTLSNYQDAAGFRANLNATIEALRNVTFVLQNEKSAFPKFDEWYGPWQARLKADRTAKWLHDARTTVVHQGELESHSTAEVRLVTYKDEIVARMEVPVGTPASEILQDRELLDSLEKLRLEGAGAKDAAIAIERRWSAAGLEDSELLEGLAKVYGLLSDLVLDAHIHLKQSDCCIAAEHGHPDFRPASYRTGRLECMAAGPERRTQVFKFSTGEGLRPSSITERFDSFEVVEAARRYGLNEADALATWETLDPLLVAEKVLSHAKKVLRKDKYHQRMMFIRDGRGEWHMKALLARDRTEKYLLMRSVAQFVESKSCDAIVEVGEMWSAPAESVPDRDPSNIESAKGRSESLFVMVSTREGIFRTYMTPFTRGPFGGIKLGDTNQVAGKLDVYYLQPILEVCGSREVFDCQMERRCREFGSPMPLTFVFVGAQSASGNAANRVCR